MKLKLTTILCCTGLLGTTVFAAEVHEHVANINQNDSYNKYCVTAQDTDTTVTYGSIKCGAGVNIGHAPLRGDSSFNVEVSSIEAQGDVRINSSKGDITVGGAQVNSLSIGLTQGNVSLSGNIAATEPNSSTVAITGEGNITLNSATLTNISLENQTFDESYTLIPSGKIEITGNTTLNNVFFKAGTVEVADGSNVTMQGISFSNRQETQDGAPANTALTLGDNVTLTLSGDNPLSVKNLTIGDNVNIILTLSEEAFNNLEGSQFSVVEAIEGDIDLSTVSFTFTNGSEYKAATVDTIGGSISVTEAHSIPEPTTATLSLLALAALAARHRRK